MRERGCFNRLVVNELLSNEVVTRMVILSNVPHIQTVQDLKKNLSFSFILKNQKKFTIESRHFQLKRKNRNIRINARSIDILFYLNYRRRINTHYHSLMGRMIYHHTPLYFIVLVDSIDKYYADCINGKIIYRKSVQKFMKEVNRHHFSEKIQFEMYEFLKINGIHPPPKKNELEDGPCI